jgi:hypothetical protein
MREDVEETDLPGLPSKQLTKIKSKMKSSWFKSLMLKKKVKYIHIVKFLEIKQSKYLTQYVSIIFELLNQLLGCSN